MTSSHVPPTLALQVREARLLNLLIRLLRLGALDGSVLPAYQAGAHIQVQVTLPAGQADWRHYSLTSMP